jgi:hypothetical protein
MKIKLCFRHVILLFFLLSASVCQAESDEYGFPYSNPYEATILTTPVDLKAQIPESTTVKELEMTVFPDRKISEVFWYNERLYYSITAQKNKAPVMFIIAGTGARYDSPKAQMMRNAFFEAGFHVISLSSSTHPNFITTASSTAAPGDIRSDSRDLYRVMTLVWEKAKTKMEASDFYLSGYSLGGSQAAFIALLDETQKNFNFKKVLMINPAISLYDAAVRIDKMFVDHIPGGIDHFDEFYRSLMKNIENQYLYGDVVDLNQEFIYRAFNKVLPSESEQKAIIGFSFRISAANILFVTDVMTNSGWIVPKNLELTKTSSTTDYSKVAARSGGFAFYAENLLLPVLQNENPKLSLTQLIRQSSLTSIEEYLKNSDKIGLMTNEDDFILGPGDIDYLKRVFQSRAKIYPRGGHCGNMDYKDNVAYMVEYIKGK